MRPIDDILMALAGISSSKLRSALTVLGVLIGVAAVIILVAFGTGSSQAVESRIDQLGTNTLTVINHRPLRGGRSVTGTQTRQATLTIADVNAIEDPIQRARRRVGLAGSARRRSRAHTTAPPTARR